MLLLNGVKPLQRFHAIIIQACVRAAGQLHIALTSTCVVNCVGWAALHKRTCNVVRSENSLPRLKLYAYSSSAAATRSIIGGCYRHLKLYSASYFMPVAACQTPESRG